MKRFGDSVKIKLMHSVSQSECLNGCACECTPVSSNVSVERTCSNHSFFFNKIAVCNLLLSRCVVDLEEISALGKWLKNLLHHFPYMGFKNKNLPVAYCCWYLLTLTIICHSKIPLCCTVLVFTNCEQNVRLLHPANELGLGKHSVTLLNTLW